MFLFKDKEKTSTELFQQGLCAYRQQKYTKALSCYKKAADQGNAQAQCNLGDMYASGRGVKQDDTLACHWYRKAADQGFSDAQFNLGFMYANGHGIKQDKAIACQWYQKAADQGDSQAKEALEKLKKELSNESLQESTIVKPRVIIPPPLPAKPFISPVLKAAPTNLSISNQDKSVNQLINNSSQISLPSISNNTHQVSNQFNNLSINNRILPQTIPTTNQSFIPSLPQSPLPKNNVLQNQLPMPQTIKQEQIWFNKAISFYNEGKLVEASACYDQALAVNSKYAIAWFGKGNILKAQNKFIEALHCYDQALASNSKLKEAWVNKGIVLQQQSKLTEAIICYDQALKLDNNYILALNNKANILNIQGNYSEALDYCNQALSIDNKMKLAWFNKGAILQNQKKFTEALYCYDQVLTLDNKHILSLTHKATILLVQSKFTEALDYCNQALAIDNKIKLAWLHKGCILLHIADNTVEAMECFEQALAIDSKYTAAWINKSVILSKQTRFDKALSYCEQAISIEPKNLNALNEKGWLLFHLKRISEANEVINTALTIDGNHKDIIVTKAYLNLVENKIDEANVLLQQVLKQRNADTIYSQIQAIQGQGLIAYSKQDYKKAQQFFIEAEQQAEQQPIKTQFFLIIMRGTILAHWQQWTEAKQAFDRALILVPNSVWLRNQLQFIAEHSNSVLQKTSSPSWYSSSSSTSQNSNSPFQAATSQTRINQIVEMDEKNKLIKPNFFVHISDTSALNLVNKAFNLGLQTYFSEAINCCEQAIVVEPKNINAWINKCWFLFYLNRINELKEAMNTSLAIDANHQLNFVMKAYINLLENQIGEAEDLFQRILKQKNDYYIYCKIYALNGQGLIAYSKQDYKKAQQFFIEAEQQAQQQPINTQFFLIIMRGFILTHWQHWIEAKKAFDRALMLASNSVWLRNQLQFIAEQSNSVLQKTSSPSWYSSSSSTSPISNSPCQNSTQFNSPNLNNQMSSNSLIKPSVTLLVPTIARQQLTLGKKLGQGGFGWVYEGLWQYNAVAIKTLLSDMLSDEALAEFEHETSLMGRLTHPNIVRLYGVSCDEKPYYMVLELMSNGSLYSYLRHKNPPIPLTPALQQQIALDMTKGLAFLHNQRIIHRDLKSHNVLLGDKLEAKLADFGLAKVKIETSASSTKTSGAGTHRWMGPELFKRGVKQSSQSDMFSYAVTLWELVTGKLPFADAADGFQVSQWIKDGEREDIPSDCLPILAELITRCWTQNPDERLTAEQALQQLIAAATSSSSTLPFKIPSHQLTLGKSLGKGGFGIVVEGTWQDKGVAIKILFLANQQVLNDLLAEFQQEINVMSKLKHPNIVILYGTSETKMMGETLPCMVMELMSNGSLKSYIIKSNAKQQPFTTKMQLQLTFDITKGLAFLHQKNIIHRDLKPDNVLLDNQLHAKLADFGLAKVKETSQASMTEGCGTTGGWMAPELLSYQYNEHGKLNHTSKSDMFSYAMTLWALWARYQKPFKQVASPMAINQMIIQGERETIPHDCTPLIHQLITLCWSQNPNERLTAAQALAQLVAAEPQEANAPRLN